MLKNRLTPYILVSVLIHTGFLLGMHSFLRLPDAESEPPVLIPVEMVVLREQPPDPALRITASEPMATKKQDSIAQSQLSTDMEADQHIDDIADPIPTEGDYQPSVNLATIETLRVKPMASERPKAAGQLETTLSQIPLLDLSPPEEQISEMPPSAKESKSEPRLTVDTIPTPSVTPAKPKGKEVASEPVILAVQMSSLLLSPVDPSPPTGSSPLDISTSADLVEAKAAVSPHYSQASQKAVTSLVATPDGDDFISELRPLPTVVESEPRLMAATLQISSHPNGAQVYVDGMLSGKTPLDMELTLGKHEVRLALRAHYDWKAQIELTETNQSIPIYFRLLPVE
jgi:hypothetical protein